MIKSIKNLYHKINCYFGQHAWKALNKPVNTYYPCYYRTCTHCGKQQYKELSPYKRISEQKSTVWQDSVNVFKTDTQLACEKAKDSLSKAKFLYDELSKFDSCIEEKTKTFMHLVNATKNLSKDYMDLKEDIRNLHIKKQKTDLRKEENNES